MAIIIGSCGVLHLCHKFHITLLLGKLLSYPKYAFSFKVSSKNQPVESIFYLSAHFLQLFSHDINWNSRPSSTTVLSIFSGGLLSIYRRIKCFRLIFKCLLFISLHFPNRSASWLLVCKIVFWNLSTIFGGNNCMGNEWDICFFGRGDRTLVNEGSQSKKNLREGCTFKK